MKRNILITLDENEPISKRPVEMVERKGRGHPDYIADGAAEAVSRALSKYYLNTFGMILHHNVDKGLVVGGSSNPKFGGGEVLEPIYIIIAGRATTSVQIKEGVIEHVPLGSLVIGSIKEFLKNNFRFLDVDKHVIIDYMIRPGSRDLRALFENKETIPPANDTSIGVGFAPLTPTEKLVLETEQYLNSPETKKELPELGEDIKVMGLREGNKITLSIAIAMVSRYIPDPDHYLSVKTDVIERVKKLASRITDMDVEVYVNTADRPNLGAYYLTVTGTSAEAGDDGNTGRGNRANGLITPFRPMSMEAVAGKNPVNHVGKIYNVLAHIIANRIYTEVKGIEGVTVRLLSQIGKPIDQPLIANISLNIESKNSFNTIRYEAETITDDELSRITRLTSMIIENKTPLPLF
jgi:S-adenosylmethionine synthetase